MGHPANDQLARALTNLSSRRGLALVAAVLPGLLHDAAAARKKSPLDRRRKRAERRAGKRTGNGKDRDNRKKSRKGKKGKKSGTGFPADCELFVIAAGPNRADRFKHTDDDLLIELLPARGTPKVVFRDDNDAPNGPGGSHLAVDPFAAAVGDRIRIVARNEVPGGCELDAIWLHCVEGKGGSVKLLDAITPAHCAKDADTVGVFLDTTVRVRNRP